MRTRQPIGAIKVSALDAVEAVGVGAFWGA